MGTLSPLSYFPGMAVASAGNEVDLRPVPDGKSEEKIKKK